MHSYQLVVIINPEIAEESIPSVIEKMTQFITQRGGAIIGVDHWGRRKLAYPIKHHREGDYVVAQLELEPGKVRELEASLKLSDEFLRHLLVRLGGH